jgi:hypothetical protein
MPDKIAINRALSGLSLGTLADGGALVSMLASFVDGHDHFRQLLVKCKPEDRRDMYESMRPYLPFVPLHLDQYLSDAARIAAERQWPVQGEDGKLKPFKVGEVTSEEKIIADAIAQSLAEAHLTLRCRKCTKEATFHGLRKADAVFAARQDGWAYDEIAGEGFEVCPECPATRNLSAA